MKLKGLITIIFCLLFTIEAYSVSVVCNYKYRKRISFDPTKVSGPADLTNYTALINITSDPDLQFTPAGHVQNASGFDIIFTAADGVTMLDFQLEKYTSGTGELVVWVRIPIISTTYSTDIYMYYGNGAILADQSVNTTWSAGYKGVWHLHNNILTDGTSNGNNGINSGSANTATAEIAGGRSFPGTGTDYVQLPLTGANGGSGNGTVGLWGRVTTLAASKYFLAKQPPRLQQVMLIAVQLYINDVAGNLYLGMGSNHSLQTNVQALAINTWYNIVLTWATTGAGVGTYSIFVNGVQKGSAAYAGFTAMHTFADIGNDGESTQRTEELTGKY